MAREMKDSGIEWIGDIPQTWGIIRFKYLHDGLNTGEAIDKIYWSANTNNRVFYTAGLVPIRTNYKDFPEWKYTTENDLLLARNGTPYVYFPEANACYTDHIIRATMKSGVNRRYVQYSLQQSIASVVVETVSLPTWSASLWNEQSIAWPSYDEQKAIADFLDRICAEIDAVIEKTKEAIEEYKKLKQSVIANAVTKGIRGNRLMKDSGVEWVPSIPTDWTVCRGKYLFRETNERSETGNEELLTVSHITGITPRSQKNVNMFMSESLVGYKVCHVGDIAANTMWMWQGAIGVSNYEGVISPSYNTYRQSAGAYESRYLDYLLRIRPLIDVYSLYSTGITASRLRLYPEQFLSLRFIVPPLREQKEIADYLDSKIREVDSLVLKKEQYLAEIEAYKKSLIYEYVTGKKEISGNVYREYNLPKTAHKMG